MRRSRSGSATAPTSTYTDYSDPVIPDWSSLQLPNTWPDLLDLSRPRDLLAFFKRIFGKRRPVELPDSLPGKNLIPKYALQEFHRLPNGNFSNTITHGYITGFELTMLNRMEPCREQLAERLQHCTRVLDVGCSGGRTAAAIKRKGVEDVWGLDISPYLLKHAAKANPDIHFVQGRAEQTGFCSQRFDGISACYLFHEIPPKYANQALEEFNRILEMDGMLAIMEPYATHFFENSPLKLFKYDGFASFYFKALAKFVYEPFLDHWHKQDIERLLDSKGFTLIDDVTHAPTRIIIAKKVRELSV